MTWGDGVEVGASICEDSVGDDRGNIEAHCKEEVHDWAEFSLNPKWVHFDQMMMTVGEKDGRGNIGA